MSQVCEAGTGGRTLQSRERRGCGGRPAGRRAEPGTACARGGARPRGFAAGACPWGPRRRERSVAGRGLLSWAGPAPHPLGAVTPWAAGPQAQAQGGFLIGPQNFPQVSARHVQGVRTAFICVRKMIHALKMEENVGRLKKSKALSTGVQTVKFTVHPGSWA